MKKKHKHSKTKINKIIKCIRKQNINKQREGQKIKKREGTK